MTGLWKSIGRGILDGVVVVGNGIREIDIFETQKTDTNNLFGWPNNLFGWSVFSTKKGLLWGVNMEDWDDGNNDNNDHCQLGAFLQYDYSVTKARGTKGEQVSGD